MRSKPSGPEGQDNPFLFHGPEGPCSLPVAVRNRENKEFIAENSIAIALW
jgi:hypothetical protein